MLNIILLSRLLFRKKSILRNSAIQYFFIISSSRLVFLVETERLFCRAEWFVKRVAYVLHIFIRATKLCLKNGFRVKVQMNINRKNKSSILQSLECMDGLGVDRTMVMARPNQPVGQKCRRTVLYRSEVLRCLFGRVGTVYSRKKQNVGRLPTVS